MSPFKSILLFMLGIIFYPLIAILIFLENVGVIDKLREYNWNTIITYTTIGVVAFFWVKYFVLPLFNLLSGDVLD